MALALDRKAFIDILGRRPGRDRRRRCCRRPNGVWGMPPEMLRTLPGYDPDVAKNRAEAREIMEKLGYGPDKRLAVTVIDPQRPAYRDPAVILIDQLKEIYIDGDARADRHRAMVSRRSCARTTRSALNRHRDRRRRPRPEILRELRLRLGAQLHRLLQPRGRQADRPAVDRDRSGEAAPAGVGDRAATGGGRRAGRSSSTRARRPAGIRTSRA